MEYLEGQSAKKKAEAKESEDRLPQVSLTLHLLPDRYKEGLGGTWLTVLKPQPC